MSTGVYLLSAIGVMTAATFATRAASFFLLRQDADHPTLLYLGRYLPPAVMMLLVIYSVKDVPLLSPPHGLPYWIAIAATAAVHLWRRNALLSIVIGTGLFMWMQQGG
jgi:branched-subunit amino acid transport protein AzlD